YTVIKICKKKNPLGGFFKFQKIEEEFAEAKVDYLREGRAQRALINMEKNWYVVHTYSGYENKVKTNLEKRLESMGMEDKIFRVLVPEDEETEIKNGKKKVTKKKVFPGYVLAE